MPWAEWKAGQLNRVFEEGHCSLLVSSRQAVNSLFREGSSEEGDDSCVAVCEVATPVRADQDALSMEEFATFREQVSPASGGVCGA